MGTNITDNNDQEHITVDSALQFTKQFHHLYLSSSQQPEEED